MPLVGSTFRHLPVLTCMKAPSLRQRQYELVSHMPVSTTSAPAFVRQLGAGNAVAVNMREPLYTVRHSWLKPAGTGLHTWFETTPPTPPWPSTDRHLFAAGLRRTL